MITYELSLIFPVGFLLALWHKHLIDKGRHIQHGWWALLFGFLVVGVIGWKRTIFLPIGWITGVFFTACMIGHQVFFNIVLNRLRKLPWDYLNPKGKSIIDGIEYRLFGKKTWLVEVMLAVIWIILQLWII
ncbi:MAG TPA: hypothetical protein VKU83_06035 [Puia sp.]|nr:hypothetical protein [Puia sp.]